MQLLQPGECEPVKASVHGIMAGFAFVCLAYNCWAYGKRREPHLLFNTGLYALLVAWELARVQHHLEGR